jgi:hypothetical protein
MMHVSWTTLREQIFAKLRRPYRSEADMNEVGHVRTQSFERLARLVITISADDDLAHCGLGHHKRLLHVFLEGSDF